ncbi:hypothetical protein PAXINDRAFT_180221 [Paxillus involutus ATCC 200175]|nr:hypothetical protein PAXINDRAFT_180221 [Paxillus involutus ATCC 200175]
MANNPKTPSRFRSRSDAKTPLTPSLISSFNAVSLGSPQKRGVAFPPHPADLSNPFLARSRPASPVKRTTASVAGSGASSSNVGVIRKGGIESRLDVVAHDYHPPSRPELKRSRSTPSTRERTLSHSSTAHPDRFITSREDAALPSSLSSGATSATAMHLVATLHGHTGEVCGLRWSAGGEVLASGGNDNVVNLWDGRGGDVGGSNARGTPKWTKRNHTAAVKALAFSPWSPLLASGGGTSDTCIHIWNMNTGARLHTYHTGAQVTGVHWSLDRKELVSTHGFPGNGVVGWGYPPTSSSSSGSSGSGSSATMSATSAPRGVGTAGTTPTPSPKLFEIRDAHDSRVLFSALSPNGEVLVTGAGDENLKFWRIWEAKDSKSGKKKEDENDKQLAGTPTRWTSQFLFKKKHSGSVSTRGLTLDVAGIYPFPAAQARTSIWSYPDPFCPIPLTMVASAKALLIKVAHRYSGYASMADPDDKQGERTESGKLRQSELDFTQAPLVLWFFIGKG